MSEYFRKYIKKEHYATHQYEVYAQLAPTLSSRHPSGTAYWKYSIFTQQALKRRQWKETDADDWDVMWAEKDWIHEVMDHVHMSNNQRVNHFRNHYELTRKDLMIKNLKRFKKTLEKEGKLEEAAGYNFFPLTFHLPSEFPIFCEEFKRNSGNDNKNVWIMKPVGKSQGKGIFLFNKLSQINSWKNTFRYNPDNPQAEPYIVQKYISDPLLIGGKKFDMRIYVLCTSYQPLTLYVYRTGFARFTHSRYGMEDITNNYVHLTNVAIQKTADNYDEKLGGKWNLQTLKLYLMTKYGQEKVTESFAQIQQLMVRSLLAVQKIIINDKHCFELYGFDVLLDANLKPWLLEVNASPSMTSNTAQDFELKVGILDDVFTILDVEKTLNGAEEQIGGFDLVYRGQPVKLPMSSTYTTLLGAFNNRAQQLKKLAKSTAIRLAQTYAETQQKALEAPQKKDPSVKDNSNNFTGPGDKQMRSSSKGPQALQNANNQSKLSANSKVSSTFKRNPQPPQGFPKQPTIRRNPGQTIPQQIQQQNSSSKKQQSDDQLLSANQRLQKLNDNGSKIQQFQPYKQQQQGYSDVMGFAMQQKQNEEE